MTIERGYVSVPAGQLHFRRAGSGPRTIVLLHQSASSSAMYERFMLLATEALGTDACTLLALDTPGFGMSYRPAARYSIHSWSADILAALSGLGVERFHLLGHHTGAAVAIRMAAEAPERVDSLAMIGAMVLTPAERDGWLQSIRPMEPDDEGSHLRIAWQQVRTIDSESGSFPPDVELSHREAADKLLAGTRWHEAYEAVFSTDISADLARTRCPALLLCGTADILSPYVGGTLQARSGIEYVPLDAGAYVLDQCPEQVFRAYLPFTTLKEGT